MELSEKPKNPGTSTRLIVIIVITSLVAGGLFGYMNCYFVTSKKIDSLQNQVTSLQSQLSHLQSAQSQDYQNITVLSEENVSVSQLYAQVEDSVVVIRGMILSHYDFFGRPYYTQVQGSGFVYNLTRQMVIVTNYHVVSDAVNITVTFVNGNAYTATVLGSDPYAELAVLSADAPKEEYKPLEIVSSSSLQVGDQVMVVGTPYGLAGSMSTGLLAHWAEH